MNCCTQDCNQGRDCPARVARVKLRMPAAEPLSPPSWRNHLRDLARWMLVCFAAQLLAITFVVLS